MKFILFILFIPSIFHPFQQRLRAASIHSVTSTKHRSLPPPITTLGPGPRTQLVYVVTKEFLLPSQGHKGTKIEIIFSSHARCPCADLHVPNSAIYADLHVPNSTIYTRQKKVPQYHSGKCPLLLLFIKRPRKFG